MAITPIIVKKIVSGYHRGMPRRSPSSTGRARAAARQGTLADLTPRHVQMLSQVWFNDGLSRSDLHKRTGVRLRTVGTLIDDMVRWKLVEEGEPRIAGVGRPQIPLGVKAHGVRLVGVSIGPERVSAAATWLLPDLASRPKVIQVKRVDQLIPTAVNLIGSFLQLKPWAIGVAVSGFVDVGSGSWLLSSAHPASEQCSLKPLLEAVDDVPIVISNELHAMSAAARLERRLTRGDSILVFLDDGQIGASILIDGKPNHGSILAANELGHTTMPVDVERCYCGQVGCVERIFSRRFVSSSLLASGFQGMLDAPDQPPRVRTMIDLVGRAIANAINLVRPANLVITTPLDATRGFGLQLEEAILRHTLGVLRSRLKIEWRGWSIEQSAAAAAALPLSGVL